MKAKYIILSAFMLSSCLEAQTWPELNAIPSTEFNIETITQGLSSPWSVAELPNNEYLITEKEGQLLYVTGDKVLKVSGLPDDIFSAGQGGLLDVVISPDFDKSRDVYFSYAYGVQDSNGTALVRAKFNEGGLESSAVIFRSSPSKAAASHFGGKILFLPDQTLLITLGDGFAYREAAQDKNSHLGKIVRLMRDGGVPADNPFFDEEGAKPQIYSMGHRNVQGIAYDKKTDLIWQHEHGPRGGDELNVIIPGNNYGWPIATHGLDYNGAKISPYKSYENMIDPEYIWVPSIAPSGLAIYRGDLFKNWNGDALIGGLASRDLRRVELNGSNNEEVLLADLDARVRDVRVDKKGAILVLTDDPDNGMLLKITPKN